MRTEQDDVRRRVHLPEVAHVAQHHRQSAEAAPAARARLHALFELLGHDLDGRAVGVRGGPRVLLLLAPLDGRADEAGGDEGVDEAAVVFGEHALDARGEGLHDVSLDAGHQPEVEEDEPPVVRQHDVALVRVGVHQAGQD